MTGPVIDKYYDYTSEIGTTWLSDFAYHGKVYGKYGPRLMDKSLCDQVAAFMDQYKVGKSDYGKLMDLAGREKGVFLHRLYGHHLVYGFPIGEPGKAVDFLVHEFSDLFTKNGLPIIPGELLENAPNWLKKLTIANEPCKSWNFVNGFDILAGTIAIYSATKHLRLAFMNEVSVESLGDFAKSIGVGLIELAISMSTSNPLLFLGALLELTSGVKAIFNNGDVIYMQKKQLALSLQFSLRNSSIESALNALSIGHSLNGLSLNHALEQASRKSFQ
jgi:hypothetical protein